METTPKLKLTDQKKVDILEAAIEEFRETGFAGARINRIAERANVSKRTLYKHYESKDVLFRAILEQILARHRDVPVTEYNANQDLEPQLRAALESFLRVIESDSYMAVARIMMSELLRNQELMNHAMAGMETKYDGFTTLISGAVQDKRLRPVDPVYAATQLVSLVKAFLFWPRVWESEKAPDETRKQEVIADSIAMFMNHYAIR